MKFRLYFGSRQFLFLTSHQLAYTQSFHHRTSIFLNLKSISFPFRGWIIKWNSPSPLFHFTSSKLYHKESVLSSHWVTRASSLSNFADSTFIVDIMEHNAVHFRARKCLCKHYALLITHTTLFYIFQFNSIHVISESSSSPNLQLLFKVLKKA